MKLYRIQLTIITADNMASEDLGAKLDQVFDELAERYGIAVTPGRIEVEEVMNYAF